MTEEKRGRKADSLFSYYEFNPAYDEAQRIAKLNEWIQNEGLTDEDAWEKVRRRYRCTLETFEKIRKGEKKASVALWYVLGSLIHAKIVIRHRIQRKHNVKRMFATSETNAWAAQHKTKPLTDLEWVSRNLLKYGNAAVNWRMLRGGKLEAELKEMGIDVEVTEGAVTGKPVLVRIQEETQGNVGNETGDQKT